MNIAVIGLSHKTATVEVREKLSIPEARLEEALIRLKGFPHISEAAILSTCNRMEVYVVASETEAGLRETVQFLSEFSGLPVTYLRRYLFILLRQDAVCHLMRVAAGLDSLVLGEGQILAQVKRTHQLAQQYNGTGRILNELFKQAVSAGKLVRTETEIGSGAVSVSSAAVELAHLKLGDLAGLPIAVLGAGKMARLLLQHLLAKNAQDITIINRSKERALELISQFAKEAEGVNLRYVGYDRLWDQVAQSGVLFTCTAATEVIIDQHNLAPHLHRPLLIVDISVPRNVAGEVSALAGVRLFNVDDLQAVVAENQASRRQMAQQAETLIETCVEKFDLWWRSLDTVPTINKLRQKMEGIREQELEKAFSRFGSEFTAKHREVIEHLTRGIINKILHDPMVQLRVEQDTEMRKRAIQALQQLFDLDPSSSLQET
ncbi:MAG: glutamyl-tRNA reductase [Pseudanabaenaceae cyanobacterium]